MRRLRIWLGLHILPRDWVAAGPGMTKLVNVKITADTTQFDAAMKRATTQVQELHDLTETLPR